MRIALIVIVLIVICYVASLVFGTKTATEKVQEINHSQTKAADMSDADVKNAAKH